MNVFLWLGIISTAVLLVSLVVDAFDGVFDALDGFDLGADWLSLPVIAAFLGAFGFVTGAVVDQIGLVAVVPGIAAGLVLGFGAYRLSRGLMHMPTDRTEGEADLLGSLGRVVTAPGPGRYGEALINRPSGPVKVACLAEEAISIGTEIVVVDVSSSTLVTVEAFDR